MGLAAVLALVRLRNADLDRRSEEPDAAAGLLLPDETSEQIAARL